MKKQDQTKTIVPLAQVLLIMVGLTACQPNHDEKEPLILDERDMVFRKDMANLTQDMSTLDTTSDQDDTQDMFSQDSSAPQDMPIVEDMPNTDISIDGGKDLVSEDMNDVPKSELCLAAESLQDIDLENVCDAITFHGHGTLSELDLVPQGANVGAAVASFVEGRQEFLGKRFFYTYDGFSIAISTKNQSSFEHVLRLAHLLERFENESPSLYRLITDTRTTSSTALLSQTPWRNAFTKGIVFSFDKTPEYIAASLTILDPTPKNRMDPDGKQIDVYDNTAIVSFDQESILGTNPNSGSKPIYQYDDARRNYISYMEDGLLYSLVHEFLHRYADYANSTDSIANTINFNLRGLNDFDTEEAIINHTSIRLLQGKISAAVISDVMRRQQTLLGLTHVQNNLNVLFCNVKTSPIFSLPCP